MSCMSHAISRLAVNAGARVQTEARIRVNSGEQTGNGIGPFGFP
jgi:hypothetical protein